MPVTHEDMIQHRESMNKKYTKDGRLGMVQPFIELSNGHDKVLIISNINKTTIDVFINGEYTCDLGLISSTSVKTNELILFSGYIQRIRDMEYPPYKGYFQLSNKDADKTKSEKPYNPLGLMPKNLTVFNDLLLLGNHDFSTDGRNSDEDQKRALRLLDWLNIDH